MDYIVRQAPLSMEFSSQNIGVGCHYLLHGIFPTCGTEPASPASQALQADCLLLSHWGSPYWVLPVYASLIAQLVKNPPAMQETPVWFLGWEIGGRKDRLPTSVFLCFPCGSADKESACNAGDLGSIPGLGRSPGEGERLSTPVFWPGEFQEQYSPLGRKESDTTERLSLFFSSVDWTTVFL